jgi:hypothetical protein
MSHHPEGVHMHRHLRLALAAVLVSSLAWGGHAPPAHASASRSPAPMPASASGVYSAIACGLGVRALLLGGGLFAPLVIVTATACAYMIIDAMVTPD